MWRLRRRCGWKRHPTRVMPNSHRPVKEQAAPPRGTVWRAGGPSNDTCGGPRSGRAIRTPAHAMPNLRSLPLRAAKASPPLGIPAPDRPSAEIAPSTAATRRPAPRSPQAGRASLPSLPHSNARLTGRYFGRASVQFCRTGASVRHSHFRHTSSYTRHASAYSRRADVPLRRDDSYFRLTGVYSRRGTTHAFSRSIRLARA